MLKICLIEVLRCQSAKILLYATTMLRLGDQMKGNVHIHSNIDIVQARSQDFQKGGGLIRGEKWTSSLRGGGGVFGLTTGL